ncbi:MAG: hypothetical protein CVU96_03885 [Firmicutes bacterium HGW-Firmicutes-20]|nr:MAG: hypothetical protein CVU96_03885 [Firmicutes bacterium HGW-Firmicutes-20]PKM65075.1 MAG: hypothetical protein CVU94_09370 [Firmicutes bacterium HGW-Firmicutes-19]PKM86371.1 MAG: hypothetical protein CVU85_08145 [Firmicutes bacterium HGW-Firmicutes-10]
MGRCDKTNGYQRSHLGEKALNQVEAFVAGVNGSRLHSRANLGGTALNALIGRFFCEKEECL